MYFKPEYESYYSALSSGSESIKAAVDGLEESIEDVSRQASSIDSLLNEFKGNYAEQLNIGLSSVISDINSLKSLVENDLKKASSSMSSLGDQLVELKPDDEEYDKIDENIKTEENNRPIKQYEYNDDGKYIETEDSRRRYNNWLYNINELKTTLKELGKVCHKLQVGCDKDINTIEEFNRKVAELRLKLVAVASATGGNTIRDVDSMTPEEKEAYLEEVLEHLTTKYDIYKKYYDYYSKAFIEENCSKEEIYDFTAIYYELFGETDDNLKVGDALDSNNPVTRGNAIITIIEMFSNGECGVNGKDIFEIVYDYSNGSSWQDSGMDELYRRNENLQVRDAINRFDDTEGLFWSRVTYGDPSSKDEYLNAFFKVHGIFEQAGDSFQDSYDKALGYAMMTKGIRGLNENLRFDSILQSDKYHDYIPNKNELYQNGFLYAGNEHSYTLEEEKMLCYLLENESYDAAKKYAEVKADSVNRRNAKIKANEYYNSLHNGSNVGVDAVVDHIRVGTTGFVDGVSSFADGLIDLVSPSNVMSEKEYESLYFVQKLQESDDSYDKSLLTDYKITNTIGVYTIPTIVSATTGGSLGTALFISSDVGNSIETNQQASFRASTDYSSIVLEQESYATSFINSAIPYVGTDVPNDLFGALIGKCAPINPVVAAVLDVAFDNVYKPMIGADS